MNTPFKVQAISDYEAATPSEICLKSGRLYLVSHVDETGFWRSSDENGKFGWFPSSYARVLKRNDFGPIELNLKLNPNSFSTQQDETNTTQIDIALNIQVMVHGDSNSLFQEYQPPLVHIVEAKNLEKGRRYIKNKSKSAYSTKNIYDGIETKIFRTKKIKKTITPYFNEKFQIGVYNEQADIIIIRLCSGSKYFKKGKNYIGEILIPLQKDKRNFDYPDYRYQWYTLTNGVGEIKLYIQYMDSESKNLSSANSLLSQIQTKVLKSKDKNEGDKYKYKNFPENYKYLLSQIGIGEKQLDNDIVLAQKLFKILEEAEKDNPKLTLDQPFDPSEKKNTLYLIQNVRLRKAGEYQPNLLKKGKTLLDILKDALFDRRKKIVGEDDVDEWSEEIVAL